MIKRVLESSGSRTFFVFGVLVKGNINIWFALATFYTILYLCIKKAAPQQKSQASLAFLHSVCTIFAALYL